MFKFLTAAFLLLFNASPAARAAVVPDYANNNYQNHELTRAEQKCLDEGYKITYANCSNQTAPADRCPSHDAYYRSCSQEQWCRNNNYTFLASDCQKPLYPIRACPNNYPLFRACAENPARACEEEGFVSADTCQLSEKLCPYSKNYGLCCDNCPAFSHLTDQIPEGYVAAGETCTTCAGEVKTNVVPAACEGFKVCPYGPLSSQTPSCRQGENTLYTACKSAENLCRESGYHWISCEAYEDAFPCPQTAKLKRCITNCSKLAAKMYPQADIIAADSVNPRLDLTKTELRSLSGLTDPACRQMRRPTVQLNLTPENLPLYQDLLKRKINDLNLVFILSQPLSLQAGGELHNVKIRFNGPVSPCQVKAPTIKTSGVVSFENAEEICASFQVSPDSKLLSSGTVRGNIELGRDSALGLKGSLYGGLKTGAYSEVFIKGELNFNDPLNTEPDSMSFEFGCNSKNKIVRGITADTSGLFIRQYAKIDTPSVTLKSMSDNVKLPNTLASIHIYKYAHIFSTYGNPGEETIFPLADNSDHTCDDKYYTHIGSASDAQAQTILLEPSNRLEEKWQCRALSRKELECH